MQKKCDCFFRLKWTDNETLFCLFGIRDIEMEIRIEPENHPTHYVYKTTYPCLKKSKC
jgi:hypothetical protein